MNCDFTTWSDVCKKQLTDSILKNKNKDGTDITDKQAFCVQNKITTYWKNYGEFVNYQEKDPQTSTKFLMDSINECKSSDTIKIIAYILLAISIGISIYFFVKSR
jgi:hypothetical protein